VALLSDPGRHFTWAEFGNPPRHRHSAIRLLCRRYLDPLRDKYGPVWVNSSDRSVQRNTDVGGAPRSYHVPAFHPHHAAADVHCVGGDPQRWAAFLDQVDPDSGGVGVYLTHVHVDTRHSRARW
jgi:uncharacterized protein YcbK (DUF882 family)